MFLMKAQQVNFIMNQPHGISQQIDLRVRADGTGK